MTAASPVVTSVKTLPLIGDYRPQATLLWHEGAAVSQAQFLGAARAMAERLPQTRYLLNICESRYGFMLGFVAALMARRSSLLPPNRLPATLQEIRRSYPDSAILADSGDTAAEAVAVSAHPQAPDWDGAVPMLDEELIAAIAFTSGSTGTPQPHAKTWRNLTMTAGFAAERLRMGDRCIIGTVPPQHMYGLETTVMSALAGGAVSHTGRPRFPQDLRDALEAMPAPRILVTTPVHLNAFVQAGLPGPAVERIVSATAPLSQQLAADAEAHFAAEVHEIYGCTEAGSMATRRTLDGAYWLPYPGMFLHDCADGTVIEGTQLADLVHLEDIIEIESDGRFRLLGRNTDMVKVAGKRASLMELTQKLLAVPGVEDAVIFIPHPDADIARPAALVIAPTRSEAEILDCLAQQLDPVFLPRPLRKVERLPRNEVGKLPRAALLELLQR